MPFPKNLRFKVGKWDNRMTILAAGIILVLVGSTLYLLGPSTVTKTSTEKTDSINVIYVVAGNRRLDKSFELNPGVLEGKFTANKQLGGFYVLDEENYNIWRSSEERAKFFIKKENIMEYNFTLNITKAGTYYFIFDNRDHESEREISFQYVARWTETLTGQNWIGVYAGLAILAVGIALVAFTLIKLRRRLTSPAGRLYVIQLPDRLNR
jgi:hypothetical protein